MDNVQGTPELPRYRAIDRGRAVALLDRLFEPGRCVRLALGVPVPGARLPRPSAAEARSAEPPTSPGRRA